MLRSCCVLCRIGCGVQLVDADEWRSSSKSNCAAEPDSAATVATWCSIMLMGKSTSLRMLSGIVRSAEGAPAASRAGRGRVGCTRAGGSGECRPGGGGQGRDRPAPPRAVEGDPASGEVGVAEVAAVEGGAGEVEVVTLLGDRGHLLLRG